MLRPDLFLRKSPRQWPNRSLPVLQNDHLEVCHNCLPFIVWTTNVFSKNGNQDLIKSKTYSSLFSTFDSLPFLLHKNGGQGRICSAAPRRQTRMWMLSHPAGSHPAKKRRRRDSNPRYSLLTIQGFSKPSWLIAITFYDRYSYEHVVFSASGKLGQIGTPKTRLELTCHGIALGPTCFVRAFKQPLDGSA